MVARAGAAPASSRRKGEDLADGRTGRKVVEGAGLEPATDGTWPFALPTELPNHWCSGLELNQRPPIYRRSFSELPPRKC